MSNEITPSIALTASRIAMVGIIAALLLTIGGMVLHSPVLGGLALVVVMIAVIGRMPLARLFARR
ncbi:hypothetical protein C3941_12900 [Kaistia algarum]|uniref:hypothetical protein n=1 Tax=Kaistia algarum TaxID=2083279 RepID=UPI000CE797EC|nr:hypothetical protein [Kaistia algarum]MCX5515251.1 hypothetical protein [Kaistia algarum]PPE79959.1 hypothetical protein C3941_12900 [Kaistia algarum]